MKSCIIAGLGAAVFLSTSLASAAETSTTTTVTTKDGKPCKVVKQGNSEGATGQVSSTVTAGGGKVSGHTDAPNSVTVHSESGSASSTATAGGSGTSTVVTGNGDCVVTVPDGD